MEDQLSYKVIGCAFKVYNRLGPGLLESVYERILVYELEKAGFDVETQVPIEIKYDDLVVEDCFRLDILVNKQLIIELKSVEETKPVHFKQLLTYLKLTDIKVGLLINFNVSNLQDGIHRVVNNY